ncbi:MAG: hypothetical protein IPP83_20065 [Flavobacteriales bacterium]|nr:hypothetical protein [Flavobacteriales bacterium]
MQVAAMGPIALSKETTPQNIIDKETRSARNSRSKRARRQTWPRRRHGPPEQILQGEHVARPGNSSRTTS